MKVDLVFTGPPGPDVSTCAFVEAEEHSTRRSVCVGDWVHRDDGYWVLEIDVGVSGG